MISNVLKEQYKQIHAQIVKVRAENCTQKEISGDLKISLRKYCDFENLKIVDIELLSNVCDYFSKSLSLYICD